MLTHRQKEVYAFLKEYIERHGVAPTYEEIRRHFGFRSYNAVFKHLKQLEARGYLKSRWKNKKQAFSLKEPVQASLSTRSLPLLGRVAAGEPIEALEDRDTIEVPESFLGTGEHFALRVRGDSMIGDGIHDGDLILLRKQEDAENGQTVVALIDGEATVKRFYRKGASVELHPANANMQPLVVEAEQVTVQGVVVGLIRKYPA
jgi:repressor LexA